MYSEKTPYDFLEDMINLYRIEDKTLFIIRMFLYADTLTNQIIEKEGGEIKKYLNCQFCEKICGERPLSLNEKIELLAKSKVLNNDLVGSFKLLSKLRHRFAHDFSPDNKKILSWIHEFNLPTNEELKKLIKSQDEWVQFCLLSITSVFNLFEALNKKSVGLKIEYNKTTQDWLFHLEGKKFILPK